MCLQYKTRSSPLDLSLKLTFDAGQRYSTCHGIRHNQIILSTSFKLLSDFIIRFHHLSYPKC
jgi:hypothetical protein